MQNTVFCAMLRKFRSYLCLQKGKIFAWGILFYLVSCCIIKFYQDPRTSKLLPFNYYETINSTRNNTKSGIIISQNSNKSMNGGYITLLRKESEVGVQHKITQKWRNALRNQQKQKQKFVKKLQSKNVEWTNLGQTWQERLPNRVCNETYFKSSTSSHLKGDEFYNRKVALASFPGSGNTWLRHLFHVTTGIWSGSLYMDPKLFKGGFPGEACSCNDTMAFGIKVHDIEHAREVGCTFDDVVLVLRNPYRSILSEFNRRMGGSHTGTATKADFMGNNWNHYASMKAKSFKSVIANWYHFCNGFSFKGKPRCYIVNYEHLVNDTHGQMKSILTFLRLPLKRLTCLLNKRFISGPFYRNHGSQSNPQDPESSPLCMLPKDTRTLLYNIIDETSQMLLNVQGGEKYVEELHRNLPYC